MEVLFWLLRLQDYAPRIAVHSSLLTTYLIDTGCSSSM